MKQKTNKGITLIALVITIIVMLILVAVTINMAVNGGLFSYAGKATQDTNIAYASEQNLGSGALTVDGKDYASIDDFLTGKEKVNMEEILADFTANPENYIHLEQSSTNNDRAIGTDGKAVNMDLWKYVIINEENLEVSLTDGWGCSFGPGYSNDNISGGKIQGSIPQYIKIDGRTGVYTVASLYYTFYGCTNLAFPPIIPGTVTDMSGTFNGCAKLESSPLIPGTVTDMTGTFQGCAKLVYPPTIPNGVRSLGNTFDDCTNLVEPPEIPETVTNMWGTFGGCEKLTKAPVIPRLVTVLSYCFFGCSNLSGEVVIESLGVTSAGSFLPRNKAIKVKVPKDSATYSLISAEISGNTYYSDVTIETY